MNEPRIIQIRRQILKENDLLALRLREHFRKVGVYVISMVSGPGSGKTTLLARLLSNLSRQQRVGAIVGNLATENDASRLARTGAPVRQITTGTICHLDAGMVEKALADWKLESFDFLFIENVGNLVCPSSFDLGENMRLVMVSQPKESTSR
ncbi:MAG: hydrogenase nickel incorporation protein HypB [Candidatus Sulfotelmatobacter sp.]